MQLVLNVVGCLCMAFIAAQAACPRMVSRQQWGAKSSDLPDMNGKPYTVVIKEVGERCATRRKCPATVKNLQSHDILVSNKADIDCSFVIGSDGSVYTGRDWNKASDEGNRVLEICMLGTFDVNAPDAIQVSTLKDFLVCSKSKLSSGYDVLTPRDLSDAYTNPGKLLYEIVQTLPNYNQD